MSTGLHDLIDATGGGCCVLRGDGTIDAASPGFVALTGAPAETAGLKPGKLIDELPALDQLRAAVGPQTPVFRHVGADGIGRELAAAFVATGDGGSGVLVLVDRSGEARLRRSEARLTRRIDDLEAALAEHEREPQRPRIRSMAEIARRLDEALTRGLRSKQDVSVISIQIEAAEIPAEQASIIAQTLIGCVRGVDDLGRADTRKWVLILPHTPLAGGEVVATRVHTQLTKIDLSCVGVGVAQVGVDERGRAAVERAELAGAQALESGGGMLLAVALV